MVAKQVPQFRSQFAVVRNGFGRDLVNAIFVDDRVVDKTQQELEKRLSSSAMPISRSPGFALSLHAPIPVASPIAESSSQGRGSRNKAAIIGPRRPSTLALTHSGSRRASITSRVARAGFLYATPRCRLDEPWHLPPGCKRATAPACGPRRIIKSNSADRKPAPVLLTWITQRDGAWGGPLVTLISM